MNTITIQKNRLPIVEYRGQRVVTLAMVDQVHERPEGTARRNFNEHRGKLIESEDYFVRNSSEARQMGFVAPNGLTLLTEQGYLMLVKSLTDDLAWTVQRQLVNSYFRVASRQAPELPADYIGALEHLLASKRVELLAIEQRDHAIETKAEIGSRREATAMATASAAVRQVNQLKEELGRGLRQATVAAVEKVAKRKFGKQGFRPLKNWCAENGVQAPKVHDPRYGWVRSWPAAAWAAVYQIDLADLFGAGGEQA